MAILNIINGFIVTLDKFYVSQVNQSTIS